MIDFRYEVLGPLGGGQFGEVLRVRDAHFDAEYALKLLGNNQALGSWGEAQLLDSLNGDYILPVRNADVTSEGTRYIVTEIAQHGSLQKVVSPIGLSEVRAVSLMSDACQGTMRMHRQQLLHRDIKPANIFLVSPDRCVVGDLGLATLMDSDGLGDAAGTAWTAAPEVANGIVNNQPRVYSARSDVFSLGATLYWLLTGRPPLSDDWANVASARVPDVWELAPHVSRSMRDIVKKSVARDPDERYQTPGDLAAALGGRKATKKSWTRIGSVKEHQSHERCLESEGKGAPVRVCVIPSPSGYVLRASYKSSNRTHPASGRHASARDLGVVLRSVLREID